MVYTRVLLYMLPQDGDKPNLHSVACKHVGVIYIHVMRAVTTLPQYLGIITQHTKPAVIFTYLHLSKPWNC